MQGFEQLDGGFGGEVFVVVIVNLHHGRVDACAKAFHFREGEEFVGRGLPGVDAKVVGDGLHDGIGTAATELARSLMKKREHTSACATKTTKDYPRLSEQGIYRRTSLQMKSSHRVTVVHGVERGDLVDTHWGHLQQPRDLIHDTYTREAVLALAQVEKRHHGGFLVLRRVALEDFGDELLVDGIELKGNFRVILWCISVLGGKFQLGGTAGL